MRFKQNILPFKNISFFQIYRCKNSDETFCFQIATYVYTIHICTFTYSYTLTIWSFNCMYNYVYFNYVAYIYLAIYVFNMHLNLGDAIWGKQAQLLNLCWARLSHPSLTSLQLLSCTGHSKK